MGDLIGFDGRRCHRWFRRLGQYRVKNSFGESLNPFCPHPKRNNPYNFPDFSLTNLSSSCIIISVACLCSSVGRAAPPCQGGGSEFEPRRPLHSVTTLRGGFFVPKCGKNSAYPAFCPLTRPLYKGILKLFPDKSREDLRYIKKGVRNHEKQYH